MARIFILENSNNRIKVFRKRLSQHMYCIHRDASSAIERFQTDVAFDVLFLDYDLVHPVAFSKKNTGLFFIEQTKKLIKESRRLKTIIIHSWNPLGAWKMKKALKNSGKIVIWNPFPWPF